MNNGYEIVATIFFKPSKKKKKAINIKDNAKNLFREYFLFWLYIIIAPIIKRLKGIR
ncbi:MAG: hypothetical protein ACTSRZ_02140 [Promethearchaeota archaeon]